MFNIDYEKRFISLLGFTILEKDNSNRWLIIDENNEQVGFIQYKKLKCKDIKRNRPALYGYHTEIKTDNINFIKNRIENNNNSLINSYEFSINEMNVELSLEDISSLTISSKEYGFLSFVLNQNYLNFDFKRETEHFNIEEVCQIRDYENDKAFIYNIHYTDKKHDVQFDDANVTSLSFMGEKNEEVKDDKLKITLLSFKNTKLQNREEFIVNGSIKEAIEGIELAKEAFNYLRSFLNEILPFKEDIIVYLFDYLKIENENILLMFNENERVRKRSIDFK